VTKGTSRTTNRRVAAYNSKWHTDQHQQ